MGSQGPGQQSLTFPPWERVQECGTCSLSDLSELWTVRLWSDLRCLPGAKMPHSLIRNVWAPVSPYDTSFPGELVRNGVDGFIIYKSAVLIKAVKL